MISKSALLGILLLASSALADHTSQPEAHLARRVESRAIDSSRIQWTPNSAASVLYGQYFGYVAATINIPTLTGSDSAVVISMGLDSDCESGSIGINIQGNIIDGKASWSVWAQWLPNPRVNFDVNMQAGDSFTVNIAAFSRNTGVVILWNQRGASVKHEFNTANALCFGNAGWVVRAAVDQDGRFLPLANFGTVSFTRAMAKTIDSSNTGTYFPGGPSLYKMYGIQQNGKNLTDVTASGSTLTVQRV